MVEVWHGVVGPWRTELAGAVGSSTVVVTGVGGQRGCEVSFTEDQHAVGEFSSRGEHESFGETVRSRTARRSLHDLDALVS